MLLWVQDIFRWGTRLCVTRINGHKLCDLATWSADVGYIAQTSLTLTSPVPRSSHRLQPLHERLLAMGHSMHMGEQVWRRERWQPPFLVDSSHLHMSCSGTTAMTLHLFVLVIVTAAYIPRISAVKTVEVQRQLPCPNHGSPNTQRAAQASCDFNSNSYSNTLLHWTQGELHTLIVHDIVLYKCTLDSANCNLYTNKPIQLLTCSQRPKQCTELCVNPHAGHSHLWTALHPKQGTNLPRYRLDIITNVCWM